MSEENSAVSSETKEACAGNTYSEEDLEQFFWDRLKYLSFQLYLEDTADTIYKAGMTNKAFYYYELLSEIYPESWRGWWGLLRCLSRDFETFDFIDSEIYMERFRKTACDSQGKEELTKISAVFDSQWESISENRKQREIEDAKKRADNFYNMKFRRKNGVLDEYTGSDSVVLVPHDVVEIATGAFRNNRKIERVVIPQTVTKIGRSAFCGCENLRHIVIPPSVTEIGERAFSDCSSLERMVIGGNIRVLPDNLFGNCENLANVTLKEGIREITGSFVGCRSLVSVIIPRSVETIGNFSFSCCENLTSLTILNENVQIGRRAFLNCPVENAEELAEKYGPEIFR